MEILTRVRTQPEMSQRLFKSASNEFFAKA